MRRFFKLVSISMQESLHFRLAFLFNLATPFVLLIGQFMLWNALYGFNSNEDIGGYSRKAMFTYISLSFFVSNLLTWRSENVISRKINSGAIVTDIIRPYPFLLQNIADMVGPAVLQSCANTVIVGVLYVVFSNHLIGTSAFALITALLSTILGLLLRILLVSTFSLFCFYTTSHLGVSWTRQALMDFFTGAVVPVAMFPELLKKITYFTPFPYILQTPISIFMRQQTYYPVALCFLMQLGWIGLFALIQAFFWSRIRKNIIVAGG